MQNLTQASIQPIEKSMRNVKIFFWTCKDDSHSVHFMAFIFFKYIRMFLERFDHFLGFVENSTRKEDTNFRKEISPGERPAVTFRFLASRESQQSLSFAYLTGKPILSHIIRETCDTRFEALARKYLPPPSSTEEWENIARDFQETLVSMVAKTMLEC